MAEFLRFLGPGEGGFIPPCEMLPSTHDQMRAATYAEIGDALLQLYETGQLPPCITALVAVDEHRQVAWPIVAANNADIRPQ